VLDIEDGREVFRAERAGFYAQNTVSADRRTFHYLRYALRLEDDRDRPVRVLWRLPDANILAKKGRASPTWIFGGGHQYSAAAVAGGIVYYYNTHYDRRFSAVDSATGAVIYGPETRVGDDTYSDLILAGEHLFSFQTGQVGQCLIFKAGRSYEKVGENRLEGLTWNVPVFEGKRMYVRTHLALFCFEKVDNAE
jgi:hypothetical protein